VRAYGANAAAGTARLVTYGFVAGRGLYLCTHDACKRQQAADQRILDRTEDLKAQWDMRRGDWRD
jgi:hypothetical protein